MVNPITICPCLLPRCAARAATTSTVRRLHTSIIALRDPPQFKPSDRARPNRSKFRQERPTDAVRESKYASTPGRQERTTSRKLIDEREIDTAKPAKSENAFSVMEYLQQQQQHGKNRNQPTRDQSKDHVPRYPFHEYSIHPGLKEGIASYFSSSASIPLPAPIQALVLQQTVGSAQKPLNVRPGQADQPKRILLGSSTGSGKTLAYLLPLLHFLKKTDTGARSSNEESSEAQQLVPRAIVICPTHELTRQLTGVAKAFSHGIKLSVRGMSSTSSGMTRFGHVDVLFGTGRGIAKGLENGWIAKQQVEWIVVDEADVLFGPQFEEETQQIVDIITKQREEGSLPAPSIILSTATVPPSLISHTKTHMPDIQKILSPTLHKLPSKLKTNFVPWSGSGNKLADVAHEVKRMFAADAAERRMAEDTQGRKLEKAKMLIFCNAPHKVQALQKVLADKGVPAHAINGDADERIRGSNGVLDQFLLKPGQTESSAKPGRSEDHTKSPRVLITTSLLSRGLDFAPSVKHVLLIDEPRDILDFMHRAGRTGRAGQQGTVTIFGSGASGKYGRTVAQAEGLKRWKSGTRLGNDLKQITRGKAFA
ncbi:hypothetical protein QFC19_003700 [Naganishia cerealis]|uniref:Uncharacterized protein n=1 Tax=Naganishia cerealis TaxID=610337 RepID=A0ACC2W066_9TREE|nr:hypothetical protein QFC19_003700 [Naganishia cerealis]